MKKLLSVLGTISILTPSISAVVSCGVDTRELSTTFDGVKTFKVGDKTVGKKEVFGTKDIISTLSIQILEALTYSETKYQDDKKLKEQQEVLGENGMALSLENLPNEEAYSKDGFNFTDNSKTFKDDYNEPKNSLFTNIDYKFGFSAVNGELAIAEDGSWNPSKVTVFDATKAMALNTQVKYDKDGKAESITKNENQVDQNLQEYINLDWESSDYGNEFTDTAFEKYAKEKVYLMNEDKAKELYTEINKLSEEHRLRELTKGLTQDEFKVLHTQLKSTNDRLKNGIVMPGDFDDNFSTGETNLVDSKNEKVAEKSELKELEFHKTTDNKLLQSQIAMSKDNSNKTFVYGESTGGLEIDFTFSVPGDKKDDKSKEYNINLKLNNLVVGYQLNGMVLEKGIKNEDKTRTDTVIYWYEPTIYQFTTDKIFTIGNKDIFKSLTGANVEIDNK
ncbi:hypothetical protein [Spiroplasma diminutum]|uniref:Lipoprotein n=1 Tax=Spiroplasma diminutum CUAS-1 TaxID=1276221 RepID=S5MIK0_9MOLU|nr:hypothetical protein [Spiroplasma diminutum]AGR41730.1 hypothetical protein SDIMI_v3c00260 [Spiroplasma diminutum CUAS-1]